MLNNPSSQPFRLRQDWAQHSKQAFNRSEQRGRILPWPPGSALPSTTQETVDFHYFRWLNLLSTMTPRSSPASLLHGCYPQTVLAYRVVPTQIQCLAFPSVEVHGTSVSTFVQPAQVALIKWNNQKFCLQKSNAFWWDVSFLRGLNWDKAFLLHFPIGSFWPKIYICCHSQIQ